MLFEVFVVVL